MKPNGFTLIELLVVISVVGVLISASLFGYSRVLQTSRDAKRKLDVAEIANSLESYNKDHGQYPADLPQLVASGSYLQELPEDPLASQNRAYVYEPNADFSYYILHTSLETADTHFILTPQGKETRDNIPTLMPTQIPNEYPQFPTRQPTILLTPTPTLIAPTSSFPSLIPTTEPE
jgi:general secretion pathway protein G